VKSRWLFVGIAVVSAALFALSTWIGEWWTDVAVAIGPMGTHGCVGGVCGGGLRWTGGSDFWMRTAVATWAGSLLTMVLLLGVAGAFAANRVPKLLAKSTLTSLATTAIVGIYFIAKMPAMPGLEVAQGMFLFVAAIVLGAVTPIRALQA
jgi:hypothetical protein